MPITRADRETLMTSMLGTLVTEPDRDRRAQRALQMLCNTRGARGGYLYMRTPHGIVLAASEGPGEPPDGLAEYLERYMQMEEGQCESATSVATEADLKSTLDLTRWYDGSGNTHRPLVLIATVDGIARQVAVASFVFEGEQQLQVPQQAQLHAAIAAYLVDDSDGAPARQASLRPR
jgi:hypothetical protein